MGDVRWGAQGYHPNVIGKVNGVMGFGYSDSGIFGMAQ